MYLQNNLKFSNSHDLTTERNVLVCVVITWTRRFFITQTELARKKDQSTTQKDQTTTQSCHITLIG